ncbi:MAG: tRNA (N(6)-L-threonylcarbamoyladenosine(37)-C(2))-methylthiotransferase MtaB [Ignavibacteriae bacterium]|nr:tRNA (N(6)-L-threonylcarbamoyladenosine(37)-C(2))-methylthiotransferase MtaB [Ignavibacteriota bacterium]NOG97326.1 tRNA (N(6)-L-threonylcarbamoyladenosine(37)-C(2))-methylthiotransferase MtaB [Ignavibacteriota bacterium]
MLSTVAFHTLGCKLNFSESSTIGEQFLTNGYDVVGFNEFADIYIINTCTVTENADRECRQIVRRALRTNPEAFVAVIGCYAQLKPDEISNIEGVDAVLGSNEKFKIFEYFEEFHKQSLSCIHVTPTENLNSFYTSASTDADSRTRAFFKVQDGCDYKCSFCTIPLARGKSRSAAPEEVTAQFKDLVNKGYKEIILTGVNVGDYGTNSNYNLVCLISELLKVEGDYRLRISSIEPNLLTDEIIELTASNDKLCNHFHIPLQSGSSKILKLMQRRYTADDYADVIHKSVDKIYDLGIGVDVIVGFPGETENDFMDTYNFIKDLPISYLHVFTYSERPNTKAIEMGNSVDVVERKRRNNMLRILSEKKKNEFYRTMIGKDLTVLFEHDEKNGLMKGFASNYVRVKQSYDQQKVNKFLRVKILDVDHNECITEVSESKLSTKSIAG